MPNHKLRTQAYVAARRHHPAWQLLAARTAPLMLSCLHSLFEHAPEADFEVALQALATLLAQHDNPDEIGIDDAYDSLARKELREWIKKGLLIEREGSLLPTDALDAAMRFVDSLAQRLMTSTASRLSVVQREIQNLDIHLNSNPEQRCENLESQIKQLQEELTQVKAGHIHVLNHHQAIEGIREIHNLATGLSHDFRRVADSYRQADKNLRLSIIRAQNHRGEILDKLLDSHDNLLQTPEGQVFQSFQQQLDNSLEMERAKIQLRTIINHPAALQALNYQQRSDLRWLFIRLNKDSAKVLRTRARSEKDVKGFLQTGLITEHHRVGDLLDEILNAALDIDWSQQSIRRSDSQLPPIIPANPKLPLIERLRFKSLDDEDEQTLALTQQIGEINDLDDDFWLSFDSLDRHAFIQQTHDLLTRQKTSLSITQLADKIPPTHDLENIALWLSMAREAGIQIKKEQETVDIIDNDGKMMAKRFDSAYQK